MGGTQKVIRGAETKGRDSPIPTYNTAFFALSPCTGVQNHVDLMNISVIFSGKGKILALHKGWRKEEED